MTFAQLVSKVVERLAEKADPEFWSKNEIKDYLNRGQVEFVRQTWWKLFEADLTYSGAPGFYYLPSDILVPRAVFYQGNKLTQTTPEAADYIAGWRSLSGAPTDWMILNGMVRVVPYPPPGTPIQMRYNRIPTAMVNDSDQPDLPAGYHDACWMWATAECFLREGKGNDPAKAAAYMNLFNNVVSMFTKAFAPPINHVPMTFTI